MCNLTLTFLGFDFAFANSSSKYVLKQREVKKMQLISLIFHMSYIHVIRLDIPYSHFTVHYTRAFKLLKQILHFKIALKICQGKTSIMMSLKQMLAGL